MTLAEADTVDSRPARSYQWTAQGQENTGHQHHQMLEESTLMTRDADQHQHHVSTESEHKTEVTQERVPDNFEGQLAQVLQGYFETADALAADDFPTAMKKMGLVQSRLKQVDPNLLFESKRE